MNREQILKDIQVADNNSLRIGAANRILQLLEKQRYSNNENSVKRWIWELCQNAKDASNHTGKVKICVDFDEGDKSIIFKHNGKAFSMTNIMSLVNQSSSKDRNDGTERKSGKFGTGFITTHLLSEIVDIYGLLEMERGSYSRFRITLDRTGHNKKEIINALEKSVEQLQKCQLVLESEIDINQYNTIFKYKLDEDGIGIARQGIENLKVSAPFVLAMLRNIEEIVLGNTGERYQYSRTQECSLEGFSIHEIIYECNVETKKIYILTVTEENTTILIAFEYRENGVYILPFEKQQSKLFCDFPLIGSEDFPFPVLVYSQDFNPTEPRDGIYLTCKSKTKLDDEIVQNRDILERACKLYQKLLRYVGKIKCGGIFNITKINSYKKREWIDEEWLQSIVEYCKSIILHTPIICTTNGSMLELRDCSDNEQVFIISEPQKEIREKIWDLLCGIMPEKIVCKEDIHGWYSSLWEDYNRYNFKSLTEQLQNYKGIQELNKNLKGVIWQSWISQYYDLIEENNGFKEYIISESMNIIPNQKGAFCCVSSLKFDNGILEEYKEILSLMGSDCREWLLYLGVKDREWFRFKKYNNEQILNCIESKLDMVEKEQKNDILFKMAYMFEKNYDELSIQRQICNYANSILKIENVMVEVPIISKKILRDALKHMMTCIADRISECICIQAFSKYMGNVESEGKQIIVEFIEFSIKQGYDNLISRLTKPILPNQNGNFMKEDGIFLDNEIDEILKDLSAKAGYDIREELLIREIYLDLPENRQKNNIDTSKVIMQYVNKNRMSQEEEVRKYFKKLLVWIYDNGEMAKEIFPDLYKNKHYLYDDEEIICNIEQAETLNRIMEKFNISSSEKLEELIEKNWELLIEGDDERIEVTQEVLLQLGIDSEEALERAFNHKDFESKYIRKSKHDINTYNYVGTILERAKTNILSYLKTREEYDLTDIRRVANTIFVIKKDGKEIFLLVRPSDGGEIRIFYETEKDLLDYSMDWELWVEDGKNDPQKITFGKIVKLTGLNRIPLKGMKIE